MIHLNCNVPLKRQRVKIVENHIYSFSTQLKTRILDDSHERLCLQWLLNDPSVEQRETF